MFVNNNIFQRVERLGKEKKIKNLIQKVWNRHDYSVSSY